MQRQVGAVPFPLTRLGQLVWPPQSTVSWWALGAHGGAGVSTLARTLPGGADALRRWPAVQGATGGVHVLLVARTDLRGLDAAQAALQEWASGDAPRSTEIAGLALLADAPGRLPRALRDRIRIMSGAVGRIWEIPWIEEWREGAAPKRPVRELQQLTEAVRELTVPPAPLALPPVPPVPAGAPRHAAAPTESVYAAPPGSSWPAPPAPAAAPTASAWPGWTQPGTTPSEGPR
jgi:hypothetical protein